MKPEKPENSDERIDGRMHEKPDAGEKGFLGSLVTSSLIRETTENESANEGYKFGQEEETYNIE